MHSNEIPNNVVHNKIIKYDFQPSINHYRINQFLILLCHRNSTLVKNVINFYYRIVHYLTCFYKITSRHLKFKRLHKRKLFFIRAFLELKIVDTYCTKTKKRILKVYGYLGTNEIMIPSVYQSL